MTDADTDGHNRRCLEAALDALAQVHTGGLSRSEIDEAVHMLGKVKTRATSVMCTITREAKKSDPEVGTAEVIRQQTGVSGRAAQQIVRLAEQLSELPQVAERLEEGDISFDHARLLADAADKVGAEAVEADQELLKLAEEEPVDRFGRDIRDRVNQRLIEAGMDPLARQRKVREVKLWTEKETGLGVLLAKLPADEFNRIRQRADRLYMSELRQDSADGRDPDQIRSPKQRIADVISILLTGSDGGRLPAQNGSKPVTQVVVTALGVIDGTDPNGVCEVVGTGPVPRNYLESLSPDTLLAAMLYDRMGRVLWLGRNQRLGSAAQRLAVGGTGWRMLRVRRPHAPMRTPPHPRMAPRPRTPPTSTTCWLSAPPIIDGSKLKTCKYDG